MQNNYVKLRKSLKLTHFIESLDPKKFMFGMQIRLQKRQVKFVYKDHSVMVQVTGHGSRKAVTFECLWTLKLYYHPWMRCSNICGMQVHLQNVCVNFECEAQGHRIAIILAHYLQCCFMPMTHLPETRAGIQRRKVALDSSASFQRENMADDEDAQ